MVAWHESHESPGCLAVEKSTDDEAVRIQDNSSQGLTRFKTQKQKPDMVGTKS